MSTTQFAVSLIAFVLPRPIRRIITSRLGAPIALLLGLILAGSGILTIDWSSGRPKLDIDRERAQEVSRRVAGRVQSVRALMGETHDGPRLSVLLSELAGLNQPSGDLLSAAVDVQSDEMSSPHLERLVHLERSAPPSSPDLQGSQSSEAVRIASLNLSTLGVDSLTNPAVMGILVDAIGRFEVVVIQELRSGDDTMVPTLVSMVNAHGARYSYLLDPRLGRQQTHLQDAFLFDTTRIEVDMRSISLVSDSRNWLERQPMMARFRVRGVPPEHAFTFTLVSARTNPDAAERDLDALADVFVSVQRNGSGEDDVVLLGGLNVSPPRMGSLGRLANATAAITGVPTNTRQTHTSANILFDSAATVEYTGRAGVLPWMTEYGLSLEQALTVSEQLPVWAEFSVYEGGTAGWARLPSELSRRAESSLVR
jgi:deoxyribonuclease-1-like protein